MGMRMGRFEVLAMNWRDPGHTARLAEGLRALR
jgi:hypothetical protein